MTREELELLTDIRDFTTLSYVIFRREFLEWLGPCQPSKIFFSSNALSGVKALRLLKRVSYLLIFVIRESKIYIFVIRDPPFFRS